MDNISYYKKLTDYLSRHEPLWQASIVESDGSTPARCGMKMAIPLNAEPFGNLGGGEMEHLVINMVKAEKPSGAGTFSFSLAPGGDSSNIHTSMLCGGVVKVYIEALHLAKRLYIIGSGHCGQALGQLAKLCGYYVILVDNRKELIESNLCEFCHEAVHNDYSDIGAAVQFGESSLVVIMTHGHVHDKAVLEQCLRQPLYYLGMIGSKNKVKQTFTMLKDKGYNEEDLSRCHAPIGIPIGSQTPYEIAISIMAQIISLH